MAHGSISVDDSRVARKARPCGSLERGVTSSTVEPMWNEIITLTRGSLKNEIL